MKKHLSNFLDYFYFYTNLGTFWHIFFKFKSKNGWFIEVLRYSKSAFQIHPLTVHFENRQKLVLNGGQKLKFLYKSMEYNPIMISWWSKVEKKNLAKWRFFDWEAAICNRQFSCEEKESLFLYVLATVFVLKEIICVSDLLRSEDA